MEIKIPKVMDLEQSLIFCKDIDNISHNENKYIYNYDDLTRAEPFGILLILSKIREFVDKNSKSEHHDINFDNSKYVTGYLSHIGFFQSIYQDYGKKPGEACGNNNYIPITHINFNELREQKIDVYDKFKEISDEIVNILDSSNSNLSNYLKYIIDEILRNIIDHSKADDFWYVAQVWGSKDLIEVAIVDQGIGIAESFKNNKKIKIKSDEEAIKIALAPGISRTGIARQTRELNDNVGFGLYMISNLCRDNGDFAICSGNVCLRVKHDKIIVHKTSFKGTAIRIRLTTSKLPKLRETISELSKEADKKAKEYKKLKLIDENSI